MTPADREAFLEVVIGFAELKGRQLSAPALELYWRAMHHWSLADFRACAEQLIRTSEFMPTPKQFEDVRRAGDLTAGEAWDAVFNKRGTITERARKAAEIASGGRYLGHLDLDREVPHVQRRFLEIYRELSDVDQHRDAVPELTNQRTNGLTHVGRIPRQLSQTVEEQNDGYNARKGGTVDRVDTREIVAIEDG